MEIRQLSAGDAGSLLGTAGLFDEEPRPTLTEGFLSDDAHHCLVALVEDRPVGFVTGVAIRHPDKDTEMLLYELGVDAGFRGRGIGRALTEALRDVASDLGMRGMWVLTESDNEAALRTYRSSGADVEEPAVVLEWRLSKG